MGAPFRRIVCDMPDVYQSPMLHAPRGESLRDASDGRFGCQRRGGMDINRQFVFRQTLIDRKQFFTVQSLPVQIRKAAEAAKSQFIDRALQLIERSLDVARGQSEKPNEPVGMFARNRRNGIISDPGNLDRILAFVPVCPRRWNRQDMNIDA